LGDFKDPTVKSQVMDSTETLFSFVQKDPETCEALAAIAGTKEEWKETEQTTQDFFFKGTTGMGSRRLGHEYIHHPNIFKNLRTGEAVYIAKKQRRHGILSVRMLEIDPVELPDVSPKQVHVETSSQGFNMRARLSNQSREYRESISDRGELQPAGELEI